MKKFLIFILFLVLLIISEYYFLNELFTHKRWLILLLTLLGTLICIFAVIRFFKKFILPTKQSGAHS